MDPTQDLAPSLSARVTRLLEVKQQFPMTTPCDVEEMIAETVPQPETSQGTYDTRSFQRRTSRTPQGGTKVAPENAQKVVSLSEHFLRELAKSRKSKDL